MNSLNKYFALILTLMVSANCYAQTSSGALVKVTGTLYALQDSSKVVGRVLYEKLPYYDDMGMASSDQEGSYSIYLLKGNNYNLEISGSGYQAINTEMSPNIDEGGELTQDFYLPISDELRIINLDNLIFARGRSVISSESYSELNDLAQWLLERPGKIIQLEGHTDFQGNAAANMQLSQDRVDAVKDYLVDKKIKKNRVLTKAFGGTQPLSTERTEVAEALNRRVEVRIIN